MVGQSPAEPSANSFASLLRQFRAEARLTQEELAQKAGLSPRSISDLERGISRTARADTANLLADALAIAGPVRTAFLAAARGRGQASDVLTARDRSSINAPAAPVLSYAANDGILSLREAKVLGKLIDALAAAWNGEGTAIPVILLVGLVAHPEGQSMLIAPLQR
jgi:transcriptional regulator with XRE-family HTH domain